MLKGMRSIYVDYVDYDEIAHHAGILRPESLEALEAVDGVLHQLEQVASASPRKYWFVILSDHGQAQGAIMSGEPDPVSIGDNGDGTLSVSGYDATSFGARFLQDADIQTQRDAWQRVTAQDASAFMTPTTAAGWQGVDSTYVVCGDDRSTSFELQRFHAARATRSVELPTGHHPFITRPDLVVAELEALLAR
jgi:pimeloyl-ACP methyl ester carboxylesterase